MFKQNAQHSCPNYTTCAQNHQPTRTRPRKEQTQRTSVPDAGYPNSAHWFMHAIALLFPIHIIWLSKILFVVFSLCTNPHQPTGSLFPRVCVLHTSVFVSFRFIFHAHRRAEDTDTRRVSRGMHAPQAPRILPPAWQVRLLDDGDRQRGDRRGVVHRETVRPAARDAVRAVHGVS